MLPWFFFKTPSPATLSFQATHFPGFFPKEMLDFPGQYEAPVLMNAVTNRQSFNVSKGCCCKF